MYCSWPSLEFLKNVYNQYIIFGSPNLEFLYLEFSILFGRPSVEFPNVENPNLELTKIDIIMN